MTYAIAKKASYSQGVYYVTAIKQGGLRIDNTLASSAPWNARKFATLKAAERALNAMATVGGFDDYQILDIATA